MIFIAVVNADVSHLLHHQRYEHYHGHEHSYNYPELAHVNAPYPQASQEKYPASYPPHQPNIEDAYSPASHLPQLPPASYPPAAPTSAPASEYLLPQQHQPTPVLRK